ncbi:MAG: hypothetical protein P8M25_11720 [Paracoccaceae bacterium]|nr:hypothetical protein [Paracoccaceae bacterium]
MNQNDRISRLRIVQRTTGHCPRSIAGSPENSVVPYAATVHNLNTITNPIQMERKDAYVPEYFVVLH